MFPADKQTVLVEEIRLFIEYGVEEATRSSAFTFLDRYQGNQIALILLREFYSTLPEAREEAVVRIGVVEEQHGVCLLVVSTAKYHYLALASDSEAHILGDYTNVLLPDEVLGYFGYISNDEFFNACLPVDRLQELDLGAGGGKGMICPACKTAEGGMHMFGCPVEVCPWCDRQLSRCNCRFEQLGLEEIENDEQVEKFLELLEAKGRIPFSRDQQPAYPGSSAGLDTSGKI